MNEDKYIITMSAKEQIEKYGLDEWELLEKQLIKIEEDNIFDGFFVTRKEIEEEPIVCVATGIVQGKIFMTVACIPDELMMMKDIMQQSLFSS